MSIARGSTLENSYKYVTIAIDSCQKKQPCGMLYHASGRKGTSFNGYWELACRTDDLFQGKGYPMRTMERRTFFDDQEKVRPFIWKIQPTVEESVRDGRKATFRLYISRRYHANWQGRLICMETQKTYKYKSFLELMHIMNALLADGFLSPVPDSIFAFKEMNELIERVDMFFSSPDNGTSLVVMYRGEDGRATFGIRLLFRENATWQGSILWKETGRQRYFRSFLELILIIDTAIDNRIVWTEEKQQQAIAL